MTKYDLDEWLSPQSIEAWWSTDSQRQIKRTYPADSVAKLRDKYPEGVFSSEMGLKLRKIFAKHHENRSINATFAPLDGAAQQKMAEAGLETVYVSGGCVTMIATGDPGTDHADYPHDTVPKKVENLARQQMLHWRIHHAAGDQTEEQSLMPMIADFDSGFGQYTSVMKVAKLFVQAGAAGVHIDDLFPGCKRYDGLDGEGWTIVPLNEAIKRLVAAKLQLDIMGSEMVIISRTDGKSATRITGSADPRDRPFILGSTVSQDQDYASLHSQEQRDVWKSQAKLMTLDEAVRGKRPDLYDNFVLDTQGLNVSQALRYVMKLDPEFFWCSDSPRNVQGFYAYRGGIDAAISRANQFAPYADAVWAMAMGFILEDTVTFAKAIQQTFPEKWLVTNITSAFPDDGSDDTNIKAITHELASLGYVWQVLPLAGLTAAGYISDVLSKALKEDGVLGYLETVSRPAAKTSSAEWWFKSMAILTDTAADLVA